MFGFCLFGFEIVCLFDVYLLWYYVGCFLFVDCGILVFDSVMLGV